MFFIIWRGWGFVVPFIVFAAFVVEVALESGIGRQVFRTYRGLDAAVVGVLGGLAIWFIAKAIESRPGRVFIDKATGREFKVGANAGSLFFIPTRYWAFITAGLGLAAGVALFSGWNGKF